MQATSQATVSPTLDRWSIPETASPAHYSLQDHLHKALQNNANLFSKLLSERVASIIKRMPFAQTVDDLIHQIFRQHVLKVAELDLEFPFKAPQKLDPPNVGLYSKLAEDLFELLNESGKDGHENTLIDDLWERLKSHHEPATFLDAAEFRNTARHLFTKQLTESIRKGFETLTLPESLQEIIIQHYLPGFNWSLMRTAVQQAAKCFKKELIPLLHTFLTASVSSRNDAFCKLQDFLVIKTKSLFQKFDPEHCFVAETAENHSIAMKGLTPSDWADLTASVIAQLESKIQEAFPNQKEKLRLADITDFFNKKEQAHKKAKHPGYGDLCMDLIFKLGNFHNEWLITFFLKDTLSVSIAENMEYYRKAHPYLTDYMTECAKTCLLNPESLMDFFFVQPNSKGLSAEKLDKNIGVTSALAYDLMMNVVERHGNLAKFAATKILASAPKEINRVATTVINKLLKSHPHNQEFMRLAWKRVFTQRM